MRTSEDAPSMPSSPDTFYSNSHIIMQRDTEQRSRGHGIACCTDTDVLSTVTQQQEGCGLNSGLFHVCPFCLCAIVNNNNNNLFGRSVGPVDVRRTRRDVVQTGDGGDIWRRC